jgi:hypothetical protein
MPVLAGPKKVGVGIIACMGRLCGKYGFGNLEIWVCQFIMCHVEFGCGDD